MYVYKENIKRIKEFYSNEYRTDLSKEFLKYIRLSCEKIIKDPDKYDTELYKEKCAELSSLNILPSGTKCIDGNTILGMDCVIGWRKIFDICQGRPEWIDVYEEIRKNISSHILWPRCGNNSINPVRARIFNDRIDYTLFDISNYYNQNDNRKMESAYKIKITKEWLDKFKTFENFVNQMHLTNFVDDNYNVINLLDTENIIQSYDENIRLVNIIYLNNLRKLLKI